MRLAFVTPRFGAPAPSPPERLAAELAARAPDGWSVSVLATAPPGSGAGRPEETTSRENVSVRRFPADSVAGDAAGRADSLTSGALVAHLEEDLEAHDLIVLFGAGPALCHAVARLAPERTVLLPFAAARPETDPDARAIFDRPAALLFGSEAEEVRVLARYPFLHRRMRETVGGSLMLRETADPRAFRRHTGIRRRYLLHCGPLEPGRGIEEAVRFFGAFCDRRPGSRLDLLLFGPAEVRVPDRPEVRIVLPRRSRDARDAVAGALMVLVPQRLAGFGDSAAEPFAQSTPLLVNASATRLVREMNASNGGLYYRGYEEFEAILDLVLADPGLTGRLGASGRKYLESRIGWDTLIDHYDRAFHAFRRPALPSTGTAKPVARPARKRRSAPSSPKRPKRPSAAKPAPPEPAPTLVAEEPFPPVPAEPPRPEPRSGEPAAREPAKAPVPDDDRDATAPPRDLPSFFQSPIRR